MKKIFFLILTTIFYLSSFAQSNDSMKYVFYRYTYGNRLARYRADSVFQFPKDTLSFTDSGALARKGNDIYFKLDKWYKVPKFVFTNPLPLDNIVIGPDSATMVNVSITRKTGVFGQVTIIDLGNLTYQIIYPAYSINGVPYPSGQGLVTLPIGTAGVDSSRLDLLVLTAAGPGSITGTNSATPSTLPIDETTTIYLSTVLISGTNSTPTIVSTNTQVYDENTGPPTEFTYSTGGTVTANPAGTITPAKGTKDISITGMSQNAFITFTPSAALQKSDYTYLIGRIRINTAWNAATNLGVTLFNGVTATNTIQVTTYGIVKTTTGAYQYFGIPLSAFTGSPSFTSIQFIRQGTGGTIAFLMDDIYLQKGLVSSGNNGNFLPLSYPSSQTVNNNGYNTNFAGTGFWSFKNRDSIGNAIDINFTTGSLPSPATSAMGTGTIAFTGAATTIGGTLAKNLSNHIDLNTYVGSENFTVTWTGIMAAKNNTSYGSAFVIPPSSGMGQGVTVQFHLADTAGYISYMTTAAVPDYVSTNSKHTSILHWAASDTLDFFIQKLHRNITAIITDRNTGAEARLTIADVLPQVGSPSVYFYSGIKLLDHFRLKTEQAFRVKTIGLGHSIMWGANATTYQGGYAQFVFEAMGGQNTLMAGPSENITDGEKRVAEVIAARPEAVFMDYICNDLSTNIDSVGKRYRRVVAALVGAGIKVVLCTGVNSGGSLVSRNDTLKAIAASYTSAQVQVADIYAVNVNPSGGTTLNADYDYGDGTHYNNNGHRSAAAVVIKALKKLITPDYSGVSIQPPVTSNTDYPIVRIGPDNKLYISYSPLDTAGILKQKSFDQTHIQSNAIFNLSGSGSYGYIGGGFMAGGTFTAPYFSVNDPQFNDGYTRAKIFLSQNFQTYANGSSSFDGTAGGNAQKVSVQNGAYFVGFQSPLILKSNYPGTSLGSVVINNDAETLVPANYKILELQTSEPSNLNQHHSWFDRRGGFHVTDTATSGYTFNPGYSSLGANDWITKHIADSLIAAGGGGGGGGGGADTQLSNLSGTTAIPVALLPATDNAIALGSASKRWTKLWLANSGSVDWGNGDANISHGSGSTIAYQSADGGHQFYKSGQQSYIQLFNSTVAEGWYFKTNPFAITSIGGAASLLFGGSGDMVGITSVTPTSRLQTSSVGLGYVAKSGSYTATIDDCVIEVTATGQTITLPTAVGITGRIYTIKLTAVGSSTVATTSSQTIDGSTTYSLSARYKYVTVQSNNANWNIIANN